MAYLPPAPVIAYQPQMPIPDPFAAMTNEWSRGLCGCCDNVGRCCFAYRCYSCFMCDLAKRIDESTCSCLCLPNVLTVYRMKVRTAYRIKGDSCNDCCAAMFCGFCVALQMDNELRAHGIR